MIEWTPSVKRLPDGNPETRLLKKDKTISCASSYSHRAWAIEGTCLITVGEMAAIVRRVWRILQLMCVCVEYLQRSLAGRSTRACSAITYAYTPIKCTHNAHATPWWLCIKTLDANSPLEGYHVRWADTWASIVRSQGVGEGGSLFTDVYVNLPYIFGVLPIMSVFPFFCREAPPPPFRGHWIPFPGFSSVDRN